MRLSRISKDFQSIEDQILFFGVNNKVINKIIIPKI
jgi:hypothetical protein